MRLGGSRCLLLTEHEGSCASAACVRVCVCVCEGGTRLCSMRLFTQGRHAPLQHACSYTRETRASAACVFLHKGGMRLCSMRVCAQGWHAPLQLAKGLDLVSQRRLLRGPQAPRPFAIGRPALPARLALPCLHHHSCSCVHLHGAHLYGVEMVWWLCVHGANTAGASDLCSGAQGREGSTGDEAAATATDGKREGGAPAPLQRSNLMSRQPPGARVSVYAHGHTMAALLQPTCCHV